MTSVKGWHTGRVRLMTLSASLRILVNVFFIILYIKNLYLDLENILSSD